MPPKKLPEKRNGLKKEKTKQKQKQKQQQTVIVNINKQKKSSAPRGNGIEKPKEQPKEQLKATNNSFSFSMPQAQQNQLGEYLKSHNKELYRKLDEVLKSKDPVINSVEDRLKPILSVKSPERIPTPLETPQREVNLGQTLQENYLKKQEEQSPLNIGEEINLDDVTTLEEPLRNISLDEPIFQPPSPPTTIESITTASSPYKEIPIELGAEQPTEPVEITNKEQTEETLKSLQALKKTPDLFTEISRDTRGRGRPAGSKDTVPRIRRTEAELLSSPPGRLNSRFEETPSPIFSSVKPLPPRQRTSDDLTVKERIDRRKSEDDTFTGIEESTKRTPKRRASLNYKSPIGTEF